MNPAIRTVRSRVKIRPIEARHVPEVELHYNRVFIDYLQRHISLMRAEPGVYGKSNLGLCYAAFDGRKIVSHAAARVCPLKIAGARLNWASFGNVFTLLTYREFGLSTMVITALWRKLRKMGVDGVFISGGRGLYTRLGASPCGNYRGFTCHKGRMTSRLLPKHGLSIRIARPADAPILAGFHRHERAGFLRSGQDFAPILKEGIGNLREAAAWLICHWRIPIAYVAVSHWPSRQGEVIDYAGARSAIALALPQIMRQMRLKRVDITIPAWDSECLELARGLSQSESWKSVEGTQLLLHPLRLVRRLRPYFVACLGSRAGAKLRLSRHPGGGFVWRFGSKRLRHRDIQTLTRFMLGDVPERWIDLLPREPAFRAVMRGVFPIPFPVIGFSWL